MAKIYDIYSKFPLHVIYRGSFNIFAIEGGPSLACPVFDMLTPKDFALVTIPHACSNWTFKNERQVIEERGHPLDNIYFLCNELKQVSFAEEWGLNAVFANQNCLLDENIYKITNTEKKYNALLCARPLAWKRPELARKITNLAIVGGHDLPHDESVEGVSLRGIPHSYMNDKRLSPLEMVDTYNSSYCSLIFSAEEGACYVSSESLLCGVPVVSTLSEGGRQEWFSEYNSIICEPSIDSVNESVNKIIELIKEWKFKPTKIRQHHLTLSRMFRKEIYRVIEEIFLKNNRREDGERIFDNCFMNKLKEYRTLAEVEQKMNS